MLNKLAFLIALIIVVLATCLVGDVVLNSPSSIEDSNSSRLASQLHNKLCEHFNESTVSTVYACGKYDVRYGARNGLSILQVYGVSNRNEQDWVISVAKGLTRQMNGLSRVELIFYEKLNSQDSPGRVVTIHKK